MQSFRNLVSQFESRLLTSELFPSAPANLYDPCKYLLGLGGKRIRPVVCLMANELFGPIHEDAWHAAIAIELFHNFTLIHDDIMDKAPLRRGYPTIHAKYGLTAGILGGDAMSIYAYQSLARVQTNTREVLHVFNKTAIEVCEGQQFDMDFETRSDVQTEEYIHMITLKTSVLLAASLEIGALIADADADNCRKLYDFGKNLGIAFQLQDDYLDAFGDSAKLGKQQGGDILANKKTYLHIQAVANASVAQQGRIDQLLLSEDADTKVTDMLDLFSQTGADRKCREAVAHYSALAYDSLEQTQVPAGHKQHLEELARELLHREK
jgi:geranylgeranyl diphosphate synthase type II